MGQRNVGALAFFAVSTLASRAEAQAAPASEVPTQGPAPTPDAPASDAAPASAFLAAAREAEGAPRAPLAAADTNPRPEAGDGDPPATRGLQIAVDLGYAMPFGQLDGGSSVGVDGIRRPNTLARFYGPQGLGALEVGAKVHDHVYVGAYLAGSVGGAGTELSTDCGASNVSCRTGLVRYGVAFRFHFRPARTLNPWAGVGLGFERASLDIRAPRGPALLETSGFEAPLSLGMDVRLSRYVGIGPKLDVTVAQYWSVKIELPNRVDAGKLQNQDVHAWVNLGVRGVLFP
jgi:hypothetical protein